MQNVLVAGATGYLGRYLVQALQENGYSVRVLVRNSSALQRPGSHMAPAVSSYVDDVFQGEIMNPLTLRGVCEGIDAVVSAVGITRQKEGVSYQDVDYQGNVNLLEEAETSGVRTMMYISVFRGDELRGPLCDAKEQFVRRLEMSAVRHIVVRPTGYYSDMEEFLRMAEKGRVYLIGDGSKTMNPIHGADLAAFCVRQLVRENIDVSVGGPHVYTHRDIARLAFEAAGKRERISAVPLWLLRAAMMPMRRLSGSYGAVQFLYNVMTHDMVAPRCGTRELLAHFRAALAAQHEGQ